MSIDPLKTFGSAPVARSGMTSGNASRSLEQPFEKLLNAAEAQALPAPTQAREAVAMVRMARLQMMQGLFDLDLEATEESLFARLENLTSRIALPPDSGQKLDNHRIARPAFQPGLLKPAATSRDRIEQLIERVAQHVSLAPELIRSVVNAESNFSPDAVSSAGAQGLMQLMPKTAQELGVNDSFDPLQNLLGGSRYLKQLLDKYDGDLDQALAAYNWGQGNVDRKGLEQMPQETRDYLAKVKLGLTKSAV